MNHIISLSYAARFISSFVLFSSLGGWGSSNTEDQRCGQLSPIEPIRRSQNKPKLPKCQTSALTAR